MIELIELEVEPTADKIPVQTPKINKRIFQIPLKQKCCAKVLIVDDEYFNIFALTVILRNFDFSMEHAFNGRDALHMVDKKRKNPC
jgi:PleD family two-component response regulator